MTDAQLLFILAIGLYMIGRCRWRPPGSAVFRSSFFRPYRAIGNEAQSKGDRGSFIFSDLFVPLRPIYYSEESNVILSPTGVVIQKHSGLTEVGGSIEAIRYEEIETMARNANVVSVNNRLQLQCRTPDLAEQLQSKISQLRSCDLAEREKELRRTLRRSFDVKAAQELLRKSNKVVAKLRFAANVWLLATTFVFAIIALKFGYTSAALRVLLCVEVAAVDLNILFCSAHRQQLPDHKRIRRSEVLRFICCPPMAFSCIDVMTCDVLTTFAPVTIAYLLFAPEQFRPFCCHSFRRLKFSLPAAVGPLARECVDWAKATKEECFEEFLSRVGVKASECLSAPAPADEASSLIVRAALLNTLCLPACARNVKSLSLPLLRRRVIILNCLTV